MDTIWCICVYVYMCLSVHRTVLYVYPERQRERKKNMEDLACVTVLLFFNNYKVHRVIEENRAAASENDFTANEGNIFK